MIIKMEYDPKTGNIDALDGQYVGTLMGLEKYEAPKEDPTDKLCKLKAAGFRTDEIMQMEREGML